MFALKIATGQMSSKLICFSQEWLLYHFTHVLNYLVSSQGFQMAKESLSVLLDRSYQMEIKDISVSDQQVTPTQKGPGWGAESG